MRVLAIALNTTREAIRNRVLYSLVFFACLVVGISAAFGSASIGDQMKFIKDFGLASVSLFGVITTIVLGVNMLNMELGRRTIFNVLSKPVARWEFVVGKFLGLVVTVMLMLGLMSVALLAFLRCFEPTVAWPLLLAALAIGLELVIVTAVALFFSSIVVTPALAGLFTAATFVAGRSASYLSRLQTDEFPPVVHEVARVLDWVLPHLYRFNLADQVVFGDTFSSWYFLHLVLYAVAYSMMALLLAVVLFSRREFT